jgi:hypothetical protein
MELSELTAGIGKMPSKNISRISKVSKIEVDDCLIPKNTKLVECYLTEKEVIICGTPKNDDESHDCDLMGCSTMSHVIHRFSLDHSYERRK